MTKIIKTDSYTQDKALGLEEVAAAPGNITDTGFVYTKDDGGDTELYYEDAAGTEVQITKDGALSVSADKLVNTPYEVALSNTDGSLTFTETGTFTTLGRLEMNSVHSIYIGSGAGTAVLAMDNIGLGTNVFSAVNSTDAETNVIIGNLAGGALTEGNSNCFYGHNSGSSVTSGDLNVLLGVSAGKSIATGLNNTIIGSHSGTNLITDSSSNVIIGAGAESTAAVAVDNVVAIGYEAAKANTADGTVAIGYQAASAVTTATGGTYVGYQSGYTATGANNTTIGYTAGYTLAAAHGCTAIGDTSLYTNTANDITAVGYQAGYNNGASLYNTFLGKGAGYRRSSGNDCVFLGYLAGDQTNGADNIAIGSCALDGNGRGGTSTRNIAIGTWALGDSNGTSDNVAIGFEAGYSSGATVGNQNVFVGSYCAINANTLANCVCVGYYAGANATGSNNVLIGSGAGDAASFSGTDNVAIGYNAMTTATGAANYNTVIGSTAGDAITTGDENTLIGYGAGGAIATGSGNCALGQNALSGNTGSYNIAIGDNTLAAAGTGGYNIAIGSGAIYNGVITGTLNIAIGSEAGYSLTSASSSVFIGDSAGKYASTSSSSVCIGHNAAGSGLLTANGLVAIGYQAGYLVTSGAGNTIIGYEAGDAVTTSTNNTILGYQAGSAINTTANGNNSTLIGYQAGLAATGGSNILLGYSSGSSITTGANNIIIGPIAGAAADARTFKIGYHATNTALLSGVFHDAATGSAGSSDSALAINARTLTVLNPSTNIEQFRAEAGKLSTYGETSPDVEVGGLCLKADRKGVTLSLKGASVAHGGASSLETDTYGAIHYISNTKGSMCISGAGSDAVGDASPGMQLFGYSYACDEVTPLDTGASRAIVEINGDKIDGSGNVSAAGKDELIFTVRSGAKGQFYISGNGRVYANTTGSGTATMTAFDEEDDIKLVQSFSSGGPHFERVKELGIATESGMVCLNNAQMLSIGAIGQLFNVIRGLAKKLGVSEDELYDLAKQY